MCLAVGARTLPGQPFARSRSSTARGDLVALVTATNAFVTAPIARAFGIDMLFMAAGIHAEEFGGRGTPNAEAMKTVFTAAGEMPTAVMKHLVW